MTAEISADQGVLIVFARAPVPGQTKTRLIPALGAEAAAEMHRRLLYNTLRAASRSGFAEIQLWCAPDIDDPVLQACGREFSASLYLQEGDDLGMRMHNALAHALKQSPYAVIVGSDCPLLTPEILDQARAALIGGDDAVLGPCEDGGYYLIGARRADYDLFRDIDWGTGNVLEKTRANLTALVWSWLETDQLWDMDTIEDLQKLKTGEELHEFR